MKSLNKSFIIIALFMIAFLPEGHAQKKDRAETGEIQKNVSFVEFGGNSIGVSLNYSRILMQKDRTKLAVRAGLGNVFGSNLNIPVELTVMHGNRHHFEAGPGVRVGFDFYNDETEEGETTRQVDNYQSFTLRAGYRFQQNVSQSKVFASAGVVLNVTPGVSILGEEGPVVLPMPSASIGVSF